MPTWTREPLLHFAILGSLIFALYYGLHPAGAGDKLIAIDSATERDLAARFEQTTQRPPTPEEMDNLVEGWVQNEVLYREGLALGLDKGDTSIRDRVILNMKANARMQAIVDAPPETELRAWFEARRGDYDQPRRYDFVEIQIRDRGEAGAAEARKLRDALAGGTDPLLLGYMPTPYPRHKPEGVRAVFGEPFLAQLEVLAPGDWAVIREPAGNWHVVGLNAVEPAQTAEFDDLRTAIEEDWRRQQQLRLAAMMIRGMRANYEVRRSGG